jgi:drug/metabolite transporter (DMT)-like permease
MIILLRPNIIAIGWAGLLPLISAAGFAIMVICNRMVAGAGTALQMQMLVSVLALPMLSLMALASDRSGIQQFAISWPDASVVARCAVVACTASLAHGLIFIATQRLSAALVAPLIYVQLLMAVGLGVSFFGEVPDLGTLAGAAVIVAAGLYLWRAERITAS